MMSVRGGGGRQNSEGTEGCSLRLWEQDWEREPLMLKKDSVDQGTSVLVPLIPVKVGRKKAQIELNVNDSMTLACPGTTLAFLNAQEAEIICEPGNSFSLVGTEIIPHICHGHHGRCPWRKFGHVENFFHMTICHVENYST